MDYCDIEWFALEMNRQHSFIFDSTFLCFESASMDFDGYSISSKGFLSTVVDIMFI